jgi:HlyD family secretion protein
MRGDSKAKRRLGGAITALILVGSISGVVGWRFLAVRRAARASPPGDHWVMPEERVIKTEVNATGVMRLKTGALVRVGAQLSGIVRRLFVTVGSTVAQGQVIAEIDSRPVEARLQQAKAQLAQARVTMSKAAIDASRSDQLFTAGIISKQQRQDAQSSLDAASAAVQVAQAGVQDASVDLDYVEIRAPITGTVSSVSTQQGETVVSSFATPTFVTIIQKDALEVVAMVDEADIGNVRAGEPAVFTTETWPEREFTGRVMRINPVGTIISGVVNYEVTIAIRKDVTLLKPDMTANVNITTAERKALLIPTGCVHHEGDGAFVYARSATGQAARTAVTVGSRSAAGVEILHGLDASTAVLE